MAEEENENSEQAATAKPKATSQKNPLVAILLILNMISMGAVAFLQYKFMEMEAKRPDLTQILKESGIDPALKDEAAATTQVSKDSLVDLATFTVNLAQGDGPRRYVRLNAVLKMTQDSVLSEVEARKPQIRDTIISILNSKRPEDILKRDGKLYLKEQFKSAINSFLIDGKVIDVFYIGFQIN
jgi:flagellar FliL protein